MKQDVILKSDGFFEKKKEVDILIDIDKKSLLQVTENMIKLSKDNKKYSNETFDFHPFKAKNTNCSFAAVDGSHHNLKGTNIVFSTLRTGYHIYKSGKQVISKIDPIKLEFIMKNDDPDLGFLTKHEFYYHSITGDIPTGKMEFEKVTERIRTLLEWDKIKELILRLQHGDMIIFDGSLISGEISTSHDFYEELVNLAKEKGIALVGLSKDTSLSIGSASVPYVLLNASKKQVPNQNWFVEFEDTYFARFSQTKELVFRVDMVRPEHMTVEEIMASIGAYSHSKATPGYPYPMQKIHDSVRISEIEMKYCFDRFKTHCETHTALTSADIERLFYIYHDDLDVISHGR